MIGPLATLLALGSAVPEATVNYAGPLIMLAIALVGWHFLSRGRVRLATYILAAGVCANITGIAAFTGGVRSPAVVVYPVIILIHGWLFTARAALGMAALTALVCFGLWWAEASGTMASAKVPSATIYLLHLIIIFALSAALAYFVHHAYNQRLRELKQVSADLAERTTLLEQNTNLLKRAQVVANVGSWSMDVSAGQITLSTQAYLILGVTPGSLLSYSGYMARVLSDDQAAVEAAWQTALKTGQLDLDHRINIDGGTRWVRQKAELVFDPQGRAIGALGIVQDITERKLAQLALKASEERYRTLIEWSPNPVLVHRVGNILYVNPAAVRLFGALDAAALLRKTTPELIHPEARTAQAARMASIYKGEAIVPMVESRFLKLDGSVIDVEVQGTIVDYDGQPAIHVSIRDISQRKQMENQVRQLAFYDALTQLPNRRLLNDRLAQAVMANRRHGCFGAVMFLDLDNFKPLNDQHGHAVGDLLLIEAAGRLKACVREIDTVARFGGDEFVIVLHRLDSDLAQSTREARAVAEKIQHRLAAPYALQLPQHGAATTTLTHQCTSSIGVVLFSGDHGQADDLIRWADVAMYQAKANGRNQICVSTLPLETQCPSADDSVVPGMG